VISGVAYPRKSDVFATGTADSTCAVSVLFCGVFDDFDYVSVIWLALQQK
jgi:hypothetical protein